MVKLHGVPLSIIYDHNPRFTSRFWANWENFLQLVEFAYNNSYQSSTKMALYKALHGQNCITSLYWIELSVKKNIWDRLDKKNLRLYKIVKLSLRFINSYEVLERIGSVTYRLAFQLELKKIHNIIHVSMLRQYKFDPSHVLEKSKKLRNKRTTLVKVLWKHHGIEEATYEFEEVMKFQYPNLFSGKIF
ncbi:reverse transcriptase [Gossypium australe]|uniref:Reverse transcriptase n=1 Tax=Gossypium australe TaxID=47621 RepID=A0A5B6UXT6_9ROSI|nr:reverse transcriptase [Gossypium australe]